MNEPYPASPQPQPTQRGVPLPMGKPFWVYILLGAIIIVFILEQLFPTFAGQIIPFLPADFQGLTADDFSGGSVNNFVLIAMGANFRPLVEQGEVWRFLTSMFLHIGLTHLLFNAYALFIFGGQMERLFGSARFISIYILAGLYGSWASFALGNSTLSAGASGAVFGIIGMQATYLMKHRKLLGKMGQSNLVNVVIIIIINLGFGLRPGSGIDNWAHMGGLAAGFVMALFLIPQYKLVDEYTDQPKIIDEASFQSQAWVPLLAAAILVALTFGAVRLS